MTHALQRAVVSLSTTAFVLTALLAAPAAAHADTSTPFPGGLAVPTGTTSAAAAARFQAQGDSTDAAAASTIAAQPSATWLGSWLDVSQLKQTVASQLATANSQGKTAVFVTYAIPDRDCGGYSAGGLTASEYATWNTALADALTDHHAAVIVEPDSLAQLSSCSQDTQSRESLLYKSVKALAATGAAVYLDAGNSGWVAPDVMAKQMWNSGLQFARGFATNVSNFDATSHEQAYAQQLRALTGKDYVIDVSRNGQGSTGQWCNPIGAGLGVTPRVESSSSGLDALLWVKQPGESDGTCNGGPSAGDWFASSADSLVHNAAH